MAATVQRTPFFEALQRHDASSTAIVNHSSGVAFSYGSLLHDVARAKYRLIQKVGEGHDIAGERIAFMIESGYSYVVALLAIIGSGAVAVPLAPSFPASEIRHIINDSKALILLTSAKYASLAKEVIAGGLDRAPIFDQVEDLETGSEESFEVKLIDTSREATGGMMLYTSGTTSRPKGVLLSDATLTAQARSLLMAWEYQPSDRVLHVLPLHHIHGTVNALLAPLLAGCTIEFMYPFNADGVWKRLAAPFLHPNGAADARSGSTRTANQTISFLTAVPTIWARMLRAYPLLSPEFQSAGKEAISRKHLRLNISGSAALPKPIRDAWTEMSGGNTLLERYGMTEVGMALSCGLDNADRVEGSVGWPLPFVEVRLCETDDTTGDETIIAPGEEIDTISGRERQGEIQLRGTTIFKGYWGNIAATDKSFTHDGWFRTGDIAIRRVVSDAGQGRSGPWARGPAYFIQGRQSADIIKTGGEKVSALEVEHELMSLPHVSECAVVGLPSESWGQKVAAVVVMSEVYRSGSEPWGLRDLRQALKGHLATYKIPQDLEIVQDIKRNAMGKVNKKELVLAVFGDGERIRRRSVSARKERV
ncbi:hypothetical protein GGI35DRAFT_478762 [Trichoderma velutinum]